MCIHLWSRCSFCRRCSFCLYSFLDLYVAYIELDTMMSPLWEFSLSTYLDLAHINKLIPLTKKEKRHLKRETSLGPHTYGVLCNYIQLERKRKFDVASCYTLPNFSDIFRNVVMCLRACIHGYLYNHNAWWTHFRLWPTFHHIQSKQWTCRRSWILNVISNEWCRNDLARFFNSNMCSVNSD